MSRRDISNEIIVALIAIAMLALALTFGIVLTISNRGETPVPPTSQAVNAETQTQAVALLQTASSGVTATREAAGQTLTAAVGVTVERRSPTFVPTVTAGSPQASPSPSETPTQAPTEAPAQAPTETPTQAPTEAPSEIPIVTTPIATTVVTATRVVQTEVGIPMTRAAGTLNARATGTAAALASSTPLPTPTFTASPSQTPQATATRTLSATATATLTRTRTATATRTPTATFTRTPSPTATVRPSATRTPTATRTPSNTPTLTPTLIPTITTAVSLLVPSPTLFIPTPLPGTLQAIQAAPCLPRSGWTAYIIQQGDTLFSIARQAGISLAELQAASCIPDASRIVAGQVVLVPPGAVVNPRTSSGTPVFTPPPLPGVNARDCGNLSARIVSPAPGAVLTGPFTVIGTASIPDFSFYKLEMRPDDGGQNWNNVGTVFSAVDGGVLGRVDTSFFPAGIYWLQLTVVQSDSNYPPPCAIRIIINK